METANNNGPVARMIKLPQGHFKRVGNDEAPEFLKNINMDQQMLDNLQMCCENTCLISEDDFAKLKPNSQMYTDACSVKLEEVSDDQDAQLFYKVYSRPRPESVEEVGVQTTMVTERVDAAVGSVTEGQEKETNVDADQVQTGEDTKTPDDEQTSTEDQVPDLTAERDQTSEEQPMAMTERLLKLGGPMQINSNDPDVFKGNGVPTLFYTKSRAKPTLVMMSIDYEVQVVYMSKHEINRYFPIKLISRLVTNPEIIQEEFPMQIENDREIKLDNMIIINAANFTDSIAVQFPDPILKHKFIEDLKLLKDEIRTQNQ
ncbi:Mg2+ and Co2+ transporter, putative [Babesia caballi]|uniref:Mg2+ and Co2+ transporter, putative n=1 Tax=Babesia caballi TaxID=5871 RepID=A0AAV4LSK1_BABCB|nr:Mg2+ and Co2+ transporter, putative [Babesia caballi]